MPHQLDRQGAAEHAPQDLRGGGAGGEGGRGAAKLRLGYGPTGSLGHGTAVVPAAGCRCSCRGPCRPPPRPLGQGASQTHRHPAAAPHPQLHDETGQKDLAPRVDDDAALRPQQAQGLRRPEIAALQVRLDLREPGREGGVGAAAVAALGQGATATEGAAGVAALGQGAAQAGAKAGCPAAPNIPPPSPHPPPSCWRALRPHLFVLCPHVCGLGVDEVSLGQDVVALPGLLELLQSDGGGRQAGACAHQLWRVSRGGQWRGACRRGWGMLVRGRGPGRGGLGGPAGRMVGASGRAALRGGPNAASAPAAACSAAWGRAPAMSAPLLRISIMQGTRRNITTGTMSRAPSRQGAAVAAQRRTRAPSLELRREDQGAVGPFGEMLRCLPDQRWTSPVSATAAGRRTAPQLGVALQVRGGEGDCAACARSRSRPSSRNTCSSPSNDENAWSRC